MSKAATTAFGMAWGPRSTGCAMVRPGFLALAQYPSRAQRTFRSFHHDGSSSNSQVGFSQRTRNRPGSSFTINGIGFIHDGSGSIRLFTVGVESVFVSSGCNPVLVCSDSGCGPVAVVNQFSCRPVLVVDWLRLSSNSN